MTPTAVKFGRSLCSAEAKMSTQESLIYVARLGTTGCPGFKPAMVDVLGTVHMAPAKTPEIWL